VVILDEQSNIIATAVGNLVGKQTVPRGELRAVIWALRHTSNNESQHVVIDAHYVVKGFKRTKVEHHKSNLDLWQHLIRVKGQRQGEVRPSWMPSHLTEGQASTLGLDMQYWRGNKAADSKAEEHAASLTLPSNVVQQIHNTDARAWSIQSRLVAIGMHIVSQTEEARSQLEPVPQKPTKKQQVEELISFTQHRVRRIGQVLRCEVCSTSIGTHMAIKQIAEYLMAGCLGQQVMSAPVQVQNIRRNVHASHDMSFYRGVHFCAGCGMWSVVRVSAKLKAECLVAKNGVEARTEYGKRVLRRLADQKLPYELDAWPQA
jgi:hypothetical protein